MFSTRSGKPQSRLRVRWALTFAIAIAGVLAATAALPATSGALQDGTQPRDVAVPPETPSSVYFERRTVALTQDALAAIAANAERLKSDPSAAVTLVGYTDEVGSSSYGVAVAQRCTSVVADALMALGVEPRQVRSTVHGQEECCARPCATGTCGNGYRRVEFRYLQPQAAESQWRTARHVPLTPGADRIGDAENQLQKQRQ
jgi:outer membrane protein OmpA-like peptidoglycan-associated protein